jgi:hypothetical protein
MYAKAPSMASINLLTESFFPCLWNYCSHRSLWQGKIEVAFHQSAGQGHLPSQTALAAAVAKLNSQQDVNSNSGWRREWLLWVELFNMLFKGFWQWKAALLQEKPVLLPLLSPQTSHEWMGLCSKPGLRTKRPTTNHLCYSTDSKQQLILILFVIMVKYRRETVTFLAQFLHIMRICSKLCIWREYFDLERRKTKKIT